MELVFESWQEIGLTENHIKQLHRDLLKYSTKDEYHRGQYKSSDNSVAAFGEDGRQIGIVFETASPFDTPDRIKKVLEFVNGSALTNAMHPLLVVAIFVVVFLEIHPFQDGNGRLSRVLTTLLLLRFGYVYVPYSSLESIIEQNKEAYYLALRQTQATIRTDTPNWQPWLMFFLRALRQQKQSLAGKAEREKIMLAALPELSVRIVEFAREHGRVTIGDVVKLTGVSRNTLKEHLRQLVEKGHLAPHGKGRGSWYRLP